MIVGEAPGAEEEVRGTPFVGTSGQELTRMLHEAGILRTECYLTNVCKYRPPGNDLETFFLDSKMTQPNELLKEGMEELRQDIEQIKPKIIIAMGNEPMWALLGHRLITKWRGSMLMFGDSMLMPTIHPAAILREWSWRSIVIQDLKKAKHWSDHGAWPDPDYKFQVRPSFETAMDTLGMLIKRADESPAPVKLASDIETRMTYISCHGIAWSRSEALCIPNMCVERPHGYWTAEEDLYIWERERSLLTHPNVEIIGQNYLYDAQYFARRKGYVPRLKHDTMFQQHVAWAGMKMGLDFLSSMYCRYHRYWKDEGKEWNPKLPEEQHWNYNCKDAVVTFEAHEVLMHILEQLNLIPQYQFQMRLWPQMLNMMLEGIKVDQKLRGSMSVSMLSAIQTREQELEYILKHPFNPRSPVQVKALFYEQLHCKVIFSKKTKLPTTDDDALRTIGEREPLFQCLTERIADIRSLGVIYKNSLTAPLDDDGRIRCTFSPTAETYRWKSSENAFGRGGNLQNWTKGNEEDEDLKDARADIPNTRKTLVPDWDFTIVSIDLSGADAWPVAWESDDTALKKILLSGEKLHAANARMMFPKECKTGFEQPYYDNMRTGVHLINYVGSAKTLAGALKCSVWAAQQFIDKWFGLHPGIPEWHERIEQQLQKTRTVRNAWGYRRFYFDRVEGILPEAIAWIGQSNTACVTNNAFVAVREQTQLINDFQIKFLLQVHDELVFQVPNHYLEKALKAIKPLVHVSVPYDDPFTIPWGLKVSTRSWGDCQKRDWPQ